MRAPEKVDGTAVSVGRRSVKTWTVKDVADFLSVPVTTMYEWRRTGYGPPARKVGKYLRYWPDEVVAWFDDLNSAA